MRAPLVLPTLALLAGILVGSYVNAPALPMVTLGAVAAAAAAGWRRFPRRSAVALVVVWACVGLLRVPVWLAHPEHGLAQVVPEVASPVRLHAVVVSDPVGMFEPDRMVSAVEPEPARTACVLRLLHARDGRVWPHHLPGFAEGEPSLRDTPKAGWQVVRGRVRVVIQQPGIALAYGDEVVAEGEWFRVPQPGNPGEYDWRAALARQRIHGMMRVRPYDGIARIERGQGAPLMAAAAALRRRWQRLLDDTFTARDAGLLRSLLLGERGRLDEQLKSAFIETGTIHLLVVSGFNVGLVALLFEWLFRLIGLPWRLRLFGSAIGIGTYALLTGLQPPVVRATLMAWVVLGGLALDRTVSWANIVAAAALVVLLADPMQLFEPSFQLSFGAVLSLLLFTPRLHAWLAPRLAWSHHLPPSAARQVVGWVAQYASLSMAATAAIWAGLAPVLAWYFYLVSPVSVLANLIVGPLVSVLVVIGTAALAVGTAAAGVVTWVAHPLHWLLEATTTVVLWLQDIPGGHWAVTAPSAAMLLGYYGLLMLSLARGYFGWGRGKLRLAWALGLTAWLWMLVAARAAESRWLRLDVLDVGHGDSLLLRLPSGAALLVDAGTDEAGRFNVLPSLRALGVTALDALVLTHPDEDHIGGAARLMTELPVRRVLTNGAQDDTMSARRIRRWIAQRRIPDAALTAGMTLAFGSGAAVEVLHPPAGLVPGVEAASNDNSAVLKVTMGSISMLLMGDIEEAGLPVLLQNRGLRSDVLKVPHHGSRLGQAGEALLAAVQPDVAVLSVGRIHHLPARETLEQLVRHEVPALMTRDAGAIQLRTDGTRLQIRTFKGARRWETIR